MRLWMQLERRFDGQRDTIGYWRDNQRAGRVFEVFDQREGMVTLLFPDMTTRNLPVEMREVYRAMTEDGEEDAYDLPGVTLFVYGLHVWIPLDTKSMRVAIET